MLPRSYGHFRHSGRRPPSLSASRGSAPPYLSTSSLFYLFALSACACRFEVTVTSASLPPFMSRRGLFHTNQRLSIQLRALESPADIVVNIIIINTNHFPPPARERLRGRSICERPGRNLGPGQSVRCDHGVLIKTLIMTISDQGDALH